MSEKHKPINYGFDRLEKVVVEVEENEYKHAIAEIAKKKVVDDGILHVEGWGRIVKMEQWHDGVGFMSRNYAVVTFTRRVPEEESDIEQKIERKDSGQDS